MGRKLAVTQVIWGYSGGGVDSVVDSYLALDDVPGCSITTNVVIVRPASIFETKTPGEQRKCKIIGHQGVRYYRTAVSVVAEIRRTGSAVVFLNGFNASILGLFIRPLLPSSVRLISTYHGRYLAKSIFGGPKAYIFNKLELLFFRLYADVVIAVSHYSAQQLVSKKINRQKIEVVHNAIPNMAPVKVYSNFESKIDSPRQRVRIITVSRLVPEKAIHVLLTAFENLIRRGADAELVIVGDGPLAADLKRQAADLGIGGVVYFEGNRSDVPQLLASSDIFAMTSRYENHSVAIIEAMRAGLPIVVTNVGGNSESIEHEKEGFLVPDLDSEAVAELLYELVCSPDLRCRLGSAARSRFKANFESSVMLAKLQSVIHSCLKIPG